MYFLKEDNFMTKNSVLKTLNCIDRYSIGHTVEKHFNAEEGYLISRIIDEKKPLATTFSGINLDGLIKYVIKRLTCESGLESIYEWVNNYSKPNTFKAILDVKSQIGFGFFKASWHNWNEGPAPCHRIVVVLKKVDDEARGFVVSSIYPTVNQMDMDIVAKRHKEAMALKNA